MVRVTAVVLGLVALIGPAAMACLVPEGQMTREEHACCRRMARQCGAMRGPASHSCCKPEVRTANAYVVVDLETVAPPAASAAVAHASIRALAPHGAPELACVAALAHSPPAADIARILRI
jgi:hypothetical protein